MTATEAANLLPPTWHTLARLLYFTSLAVVMFYIVNQVRKPNAGIGRFFLWIMNVSHSSLTDWGLAHVDIETDFTILDVGCGGGRTIEKLAALAPAGKVSRDRVGPSGKRQRGRIPWKECEVDSHGTCGSNASDGFSPPVSQ